jgi:hypothetical protein
MISRTAIFGDSWAFSSFEKHPLMQEKLGKVNFQSLFAQRNIQATNLAKPGGTNVDTIQIMHNNEELIKQCDILIVVQTDPIRQLVKNVSDGKMQANSTVDWPQASDLPELCERLLEQFYQQLDSISKTHSVPILLIGGCCSLSHKHVPESIFTIEKSWTELCLGDPEFEDCYYYWEYPTLVAYEHARKIFNWSVPLRDFHKYTCMIEAKNFAWQNSDQFSWCHAAEPAYKTMFETVMSSIEKTNLKGASKCH